MTFEQKSRRDTIKKKLKKKEIILKKYFIVIYFSMKLKNLLTITPPVKNININDQNIAATASQSKVHILKCSSHCRNYY